MNDELTRIASFYNRPVKGNSVRIPCPAHGGDGNSLSVRALPTPGQIAVYCFSRGCTRPDIIKALQTRTGIDLGADREHQPQRKTPTPEDLREARKLEDSIKASRSKAAKEDRERQQAAATLAERLILKATVQIHPYLERKGFPHATGLVLQDYLLVPMRHHQSGALQSLQRIAEDGSKRFLSGGKAGGAVFALGRSRGNDAPWFCEGYATALSVKAALKQLSLNAPVVACFSAANLQAVAHKGYVVADNDSSGTGERYAKATGLPYWMPPDVDTDANDFHLAYGIGKLASELRGLL